MKTCSEIKELKSEKEEFLKEINSLKVSLKSSRKELKDASKHFEKEQYDKENKIKNLQDYKRNKIMEERELKNQSKKIDKKLKIIHEKEAKLDLEKREIEKIKYQEKNIKNITRLELDTNENPIAYEPFCLSSNPTISTCKYSAADI